MTYIESKYRYMNNAHFYMDTTSWKGVSINSIGQVDLVYGGWNTGYY